MSICCVRNVSPCWSRSVLAMSNALQNVCNGRQSGSRTSSAVARGDGISPTALRAISRTKSAWLNSGWTGSTRTVTLKRKRGLY